MRLPYSAVQVLKHVLQNQPLNFSSQILLKIGLMSYFFCKKIHGMDTWLKCHNMNLYNSTFLPPFFTYKLQPQTCPFQCGFLAAELELTYSLSLQNYHID